MSSTSSGVLYLIRCPLPHQAPSTSSGVLYLIRRPLPHQVPSTSSGILYLIRCHLHRQVSSTSSGALYLIRCPLPHQDTVIMVKSPTLSVRPALFSLLISGMLIDAFLDLRIDLMTVNGQYQGSARTST